MLGLYRILAEDLNLAIVYIGTLRHPYNTGFNGYVRTVEGQGSRTTCHEPRHSLAAES